MGFHHVGLCQGDRPPGSEEERCCRPPWSNRAGRRDCGSAQEAATISQKAKGDWPVISNRRPSDERQATSTFAPGSAPTPFDLHSPAHVPLGSPGPLSACLAPRAEQDVSGPLSLPTSPAAALLSLGPNPCPARPVADLNPAGPARDRKCPVLPPRGFRASASRVRFSPKSCLSFRRWAFGLTSRLLRRQRSRPFS